MPEPERLEPEGHESHESQEGPGGPVRRRPARSQLVVGLILALVGFAAVTQIRSNEVDNAYSGLREQDLIDVLEGLAGTTQRTQAQIDELTRARAELQSDSSRRQAALEQAQSEADALAVVAGLVPVTGPGVRITITPGTEPVSISAMLDTVQDLRTSGAEAIQVNGEVRVVAQTSFAQAADGGLLVDGQAVGAPYVLDVIGPPEGLEGAMDFALGPRQQLANDGAELEVDQLESLDIDAVRDLPATDFAEPGQ